ncbi:11-cis retinol dehydrogenase-like isoform X1 [Varroa jacobsoni]|uniref:11-cis retinol dehydrogenase-like isoform X1 n=2 Tax=Varroa jacobsoni TaxID=62625 RepID=UPI000BFA9E60|nr:11-cis retinol dehydrogenase-like isoform X1 [Varroa jacobsoni]
MSFLWEYPKLIVELLASQHSSFQMSLIFLLVCVATLAVVLWLVTREETVTLDGSEYVLITGCDSGIGYMLANHLQKGNGRNGVFQVIATCVHPYGKSASQLKSVGIKVVGLDFTKDNIKSFCEQVDELVGSAKLHAVVNNAGVCIMGEFDWFTDDQIDYVFTVNTGAIRLVKCLMARIMSNRTRVINLTSVNGTLAYPGLAIYCSSKYALEGFSDALAMELAKFGVHVIKFRLGDFSNITSIMANQKLHADLMWHNFNEEQRAQYDAYFHAYQRVVMAQAGGLSVTKFNDLMYCFDKALLSVRPRALYISGNAIYLSILWLLTWIPEVWRNGFVAWTFQKAMQSHGVIPPVTFNYTEHNSTTNMNNSKKRHVHRVIP